MSRRVLDVAIRSEFRKGFGDIARQFTALENSLKKVDGLTRSLDKVAENLDRTLAFKQAQYGAKKFAENQKQVNKAVDDGVRLAKRYESAHTALGNKVAALANAQKAGSISNKQRLEAEIGLLNQYIKKTGDAGILESKNRKFRDAKGRFVTFTADSLKAVSDGLSKSVEKGISAGSKRGVDHLVTQMRATSSRIKGAVASIGTNGYQSSFSNRNSQAAYYDAVWGSRGRRPGAGLTTQQLIDKNVGVRTPSAGTGMLMGDDTRFNQLKLRYQQLEQKARSTSMRIAGMRFGPNPANADAGFKKLFDSYNRIGHFLFQLQYSTMTIFGLSGVGMIINQADAYITLRNQVARTSDSIDDLSKNMKAVYQISRETFSDPKSVGKIFSTINKYSEDLKLSDSQVDGVTSAIAGAFAASPGNAQEKAASQYQFMQAIQSNRLGGDELRSVLEMAPYVGDILGKGIAQLRGMPKGSVIDLRKQGEAGTPVTAKELVAVFNNPEIQAEIKRTLGQQARTFGDLLQVGKVRLMEMTEQFSNSSGIFTQLISGLSRFIMDDSAFSKFTTALEAATVALVIYGGMLLTQAAAGRASSVLGGLNTGRGAFSPASIRLANMQTGRQIRAVQEGGSALLNGVKAAPGAAANIASSAVNGVSNALGALGKAGKSSGGLIGSAARVIGSGFTNVGRSMKSLFSGFNLTNMFKGLGGVFRTLLTGGNILSRALFGISVPMIAIAAIIAMLVMRFNKLLGAMTGGMNIMDILRGTWNMLMDGMGKVASFLRNSFLGDIWNAITGFIDGILKWLGRKAANNTYFQEEQANRMYGGTDGRAVVHGRDGKNYYTRVVNGRFYSTGEEARNADGSWRQADFNWGDRNVRAYNPDLPSGQKANLPGSTPKTEANGRRDPWPEFIRDLNLKYQTIEELRNVAPQFKDIQGQLNENLRRAMDVANFNTDGFNTLEEAWAAFSNSNATRANQVNALNAKIRSGALEDAYNEFLDSMNELFASVTMESKTAGMTSFQSQRFNDRIDLIKRYADGNSFSGTAEDRRSINDALGMGRFDVAESLLRSNLKDGASGTFDSDVAYLEGLRSDAAVNSQRKTLQFGRQALEDQARLLGVFGEQRNVQEQINDLTQGFLEEYGELDAATGRYVLKNQELADILRKQTDQIRERKALELAYNADWRNGFGDAIAEYTDALANIASATKDVFGNALKGVEDGIVSMLTATDLKLSDIRSGIASILQSIQADIARMFTRQIIMKPIANWIEGIGAKLWGKSENDQTITANNVYINASNIQGLGSFAGAVGKGGSGFGNILSTASSLLPGPWGAIGSFVSSLFHSGGTVGAASMSRVVNPSVFAQAKRYHSGTLHAGLPALGVNEIPAILNRGEKVLTAAQYSAMNNGSAGSTFAPNISISYTNNGGSNSGSGGGEDHAKNLATMVSAAIKEELVAYETRQRRPGSPSYLANKKR